jgi:hypothetical protein
MDRFGHRLESRFFNFVTGSTSPIVSSVIAGVKSQLVFPRLESILHVESSAWVPFELFKNIGKTPKSSVPVLSAAKLWFSQGFSHIGPIALAFCAYPCMSMPAGAAPVEFIVLCAALAPKNMSVSRPVSRQSRLRTLVFRGKTCGFVAEVQDSN